MNTVSMQSILPALLIATALLFTSNEVYAQSQKTLILFDASGSMQELFDGGSRLAAAKGAVFDFLDEQNSDVGLRMYAHVNHAGDQVSACKETVLVRNFTNNYESIKQYTSTIQAVGSYTPTAYALTQAANDFTAGDNNTLILLTDGKETCNGDPAAAAQALRAAGINVVTHVIGLGVDAETRTELLAVAAAGGGKYYDADNAQVLANSFSDIEAAIDKTRIERVTQAVRGGNEIMDAVRLTPGVYTLDHHQRPNEYDYFSIILEPGVEYYFSIGFTGKDIRYNEDTDTWFLPRNDDGPEGTSLRGQGHLQLLSHDGKTDTQIHRLTSNSTERHRKEDFAFVTYAGGDSLYVQSDTSFESGRRGSNSKAHPLVGTFEPLYFKVGNGKFEMHKDVPFTITRLEPSVVPDEGAQTDTAVNSPASGQDASNALINSVDSGRDVSAAEANNSVAEEQQQNLSNNGVLGFEFKLQGWGLFTALFLLGAVILGIIFAILKGLRKSPTTTDASQYSSPSRNQFAPSPATPLPPPPSAGVASSVPLSPPTPVSSANTPPPPL